MTMEKDEAFLIRRFRELAEMAYGRDYPTHTDFLNLYELSLFRSLSQEFSYLPTAVFGGYEMAERCMVGFFPMQYTAAQQASFWAQEIRFLQIRPAHPKFAEALTHRDYLGAVLNLGIDRGKIGDILIQGGEAVLICDNAVADLLTQELTRIRHTAVIAKTADHFEYAPGDHTESVTGSVNSTRLDALLAFAYGLSRSEANAQIQGERVFVDGKLARSSSITVSENQIVSLRGFGRFRYMGQISTTKKGRLWVEIQKYI